MVLGLLWCSASLTDDSELYIEIEKATKETEIIKITEGYTLNCEVEDEDLSFIYNLKVIKSKTLKAEVILDFNQDGKIYLVLSQKISSNGKVSGSGAKFKIHYSPDFDKDLKKTMKQYLGMYKQIAEENFSNFAIYGKTLKPIQIEDKKKSKKFISLMKKLFANDAEMKSFLKKLKIKIYDHYLGIASIQSEKFYVVKTYMIAEHPDESLLDEVDEMSQTVYHFVHIASGYILQLDGKMPTICTISKQGKELVKFDTEEIFY